MGRVREDVQLQDDVHEGGLEGNISKRGEKVADIRDGGGRAMVRVALDVDVAEDFGTHEADDGGADGEAGLVLEMNVVRGGEADCSRHGIEASSWRSGDSVTWRLSRYFNMERCRRAGRVTGMASSSTSLSVCQWNRSRSTLSAKRGEQGCALRAKRIRDDDRPRSLTSMRV